MNALQVEPPSWTQMIALAGAVFGGAGTVKLIDRVFGHAEKQDDVSAGLRSEMVSTLAKQSKRLDEMDGRLEAMRLANNTLLTEKAELGFAIRELTRENISLRHRYHRAMGLFQVLFDRDQEYRVQLRLPPQEIDITWIYQPLEGPTSEVVPFTPPKPPLRPLSPSDEDPIA